MTRVVGVDSAPPQPVLSIRRVNRLSSNELDELTALLVSCVAQGASLGFLAPLAVDAARDWWAGVPRDGVILFLAERKGHIVGTVQLQPAESENGAHRGEIATLLWHTHHAANCLPLFVR
jgi:hypothetical protein